MANIDINAGIGPDANDLFKALNYAAQPRPAMRFGAQPTMASPPTITWEQCAGVSAVAIAGGGTGYAVNDVLTVSGGSGVLYATQLIVTAVSSGVITGVAIRGPGMYKGSTGGRPTNPASVTGGAGSGATFNLTFNTGVASPLAGSTLQSVSGVSGAFKGTGHNVGSTANGFGLVTKAGNDWLCEFWCDAPLFALRFPTTNQGLMVFVYNEVTGDWEQIRSTGFSGSVSGDSWYLTLDWGGVRKARRYRIAGINTYLNDAKLAAQDTLWAPTETDRPLLWFFGDSYTNGTGAGNTGSVFYQIAARGLNMDALGHGIGGTGWKSTGSDDPVTRIGDTLGNVNFTRAVWGVVIPFGYNDANGSGLDVVQNKCYDTLVAVRAAKPTTRIFLVSPWTPVGSTTNLTLVKNAMKTAFDTFVAAYPEARAFWIDIDNVVTASNKSVLTGGDNVHPTPFGHEYLGARLGQAIARAVWG